MIIKSFEIRDRATFIPAIGIKMVPIDTGPAGGQAPVAQRYLLCRCGYSGEHPAVILLRMDGSGLARSNPYNWPGDTRTMPAAHVYITEHFDDLPEGAVVDVEFVLNETKEAKKSERFFSF